MLIINLTHGTFMLVLNKVLADLHFEGHSITQCMYPLVSSGCSGPLNSLQVVGVRFEDKPILEQGVVKGVLDGTDVLVSLELHALVVLTVEAEEEGQLHFEGLAVLLVSCNHN